MLIYKYIFFSPQTWAKTQEQDAEYHRV